MTAGSYGGAMVDDAPGHTDVATDTLVELEVYVVADDGTLHANDGEDALPTALDVIRMVRDAAREIQSQAKADRAMAAANRPGPSLLQSDRKGAGDDVIHAVLADPVVAITAMLDGQALAPPLAGLGVDLKSRVADHRGVTWDASVRPAFAVRRRPVRLRVYPSPSTNITFIELIPDRPRSTGRSGFVRRGTTIVETLGNRLIEIAKSSP